MTKRTIQRTAAMTPLDAMDMVSDASLVMHIDKHELGRDRDDRL